MVPLLLVECLLYKSFSNASPANMHFIEEMDRSREFVQGKKSVERKL